jgi:hypothetical protein
MTSCWVGALLLRLNTRRAILFFAVPSASKTSPTSRLANSCSRSPVASAME